MTLASLGALASARFTGPEAGQFLQSQLSADILALASGEAVFACYCTPRGQVLGLLLVCRQGEDYLVTASRELLPGMLQRLRMYVLRSKLEFSLMEGWTVYGVTDPAELPAHIKAFIPGDLGLAYVFSEADLAESSSPAEWKRLELNAGVCWLQASTAEKFIPQMLGFDRIGAVSFTKGCYPGQEIVARTRYLGRVKRTPLLVSVAPEYPAINGSRLKIRIDGEWSDAVQIENALLENADKCLFLVTRSVDKAVVDQVEYEGRNYRCATT